MTEKRSTAYQIVQITTAQSGWFGLEKTKDGEIIFHPIACWALLEYGNRYRTVVGFTKFDIDRATADFLSYEGYEYDPQREDFR